MYACYRQRFLNRQAMPHELKEISARMACPKAPSFFCWDFRSHALRRTPVQLYTSIRQLSLEHNQKAVSSAVAQRQNSTPEWKQMKQSALHVLPVSCGTGNVFFFMVAIMYIYDFWVKPGAGYIIKGPACMVSVDFQRDAMNCGQSCSIPSKPRNCMAPPATPMPLACRLTAAARPVGVQLLSLHQNAAHLSTPLLGMTSQLECNWRMFFLRYIYVASEPIWMCIVCLHQARIQKTPDCKSLAPGKYLHTIQSLKCWRQQGCNSN